MEEAPQLVGKERQLHPVQLLQVHIRIIAVVIELFATGMQLIQYVLNMEDYLQQHNFWRLVVI